MRVRGRERRVEHVGHVGVASVGKQASLSSVPEPSVLGAQRTDDDQGRDHAGVLEEPRGSVRCRVEDRLERLGVDPRVDEPNVHVLRDGAHDLDPLRQRMAQGSVGWKQHGRPQWARRSRVDPSAVDAAYPAIDSSRPLSVLTRTLCFASVLQGDLQGRRLRDAGRDVYGAPGPSGGL